MMYSQSTTSKGCRSLSRVLWSALLITALIASSACSSRQPVEILTSEAQFQRPDQRSPLPNPTPIDTSEVEFKVLTVKTLPEGDDWVYYGLTPQQYETMSRNMAEIFRWVEEAAWRLHYYRGETESEAPVPSEDQ